MPVEEIHVKISPQGHNGKVGRGDSGSRCPALDPGRLAQHGLQHLMPWFYPSGGVH